MQVPLGGFTACDWPWTYIQYHQLDRGILRSTFNVPKAILMSVLFELFIDSIRQTNLNTPTCIHGRAHTFTVSSIQCHQNIWTLSVHF